MDIIFLATALIFIISALIAKENLNRNILLSFSSAFFLLSVMVVQDFLQI